MAGFAGPSRAAEGLTERERVALPVIAGCRSVGSLDYPMTTLLA